MTTMPAQRAADDPLAYQPLALVDLLDRVLATGVVVTGDITLAIAGVDLVRISLRALIASVGALVPPEPPVPPGAVAPAGSPGSVAPAGSPGAVVPTASGTV